MAAERHRDEWGKRREELVRAAKFACENAAFSYRNFHVGAAVLGWSAARGTYDIGVAGNLKEREKSEVGDDKRCAERGAIDHMLAKAPDAKIVGIVVVSKEVGTTPGSDLHTKTLHCCEQCRSMLEEKKCVNKQAPILTVNHRGDEDMTEEMTVQDMLDLYDKDKHTYKSLAA